MFERRVSRVERTRLSCLHVNEIIDGLRMNTAPVSILVRFSILEGPLTLAELLCACKCSCRTLREEAGMVKLQYIGGLLCYVCTCWESVYMIGTLL